MRSVIYPVAAFITLNCLGLLLTGIDKYRATHHKWRISERTFFCLAALGGSIGVYCGCLLFRHKTKQPRFMVGIPVIIAIQILLAFGWFFRFK